jgi:beta-lactamase class D
MSCQHTLKLIALLLFLCTFTLSAEENFFLADGKTGEKLSAIGSQVYERLTPCSTFKIALSLMGYQEGILKDETQPTWSYQVGYVDYLPSWKVSQTPYSWMKNSCVWYSQKLAFLMGLEKIDAYLTSFDYGNCNMSGDADAWQNPALGISPRPWICSSLKISPEEQVSFIRKMVRRELTVSNYATQMTKALLFIEELPNGWKLYGKTGAGSISSDKTEDKTEIGWFVGWIEDDKTFLPFAYCILDKKVDNAQRIPRTKQLLLEHAKPLVDR